jgi:hypothetical protein
MYIQPAENKAEPRRRKKEMYIRDDYYRRDVSIFFVDNNPHVENYSIDFNPFSLQHSINSYKSNSQ